MNDPDTILMSDPQEEIALLVETLHQTQQRLLELTGGEVDAIVLPGGQSFLLHEAQEKLRESEERFRSTFEQAAVGMAHVSPRGNFLRVNDKLCETLGYTRAELLRMNFAEMTMPDDQEAAVLARSAMLAGTQKSYNVEKRYRRKDGTLIWINLVTALERTSRNEDPYFISVFVDVTSRKQAEANLHASEVLLRQFIQHTPAAIAMLDTNMCYLQTSDRWMQDYHLTGQDLTGRSHYEVFPDVPERWKVIHQRVLQGAVESCDEDCFPRADGSTDWLQWEAFPWWRADGQIGGLIFFTQVITERKQAEMALRVSEERFREISSQLAKVLDSSVDVICVFDAHGNFTLVSAACERVWGYRPEELLGTPYANKVVLEDLEGTVAEAARIMQGTATNNFENRYVRKDGTITHMMWSAWWSEADQRMYCVARDNTNALKAQEETREMADRLALATKASRVGIWDWNLTTSIMHWDEQMYALYGLQTQNEQGVEIWKKQLHPEDFARANAEIEAALNIDGMPFDTSFRILVPPDNTIRHIRALGHVFRDRAGRPIRMLGTNWDVTEQVAREDMLRQKLENEGALLQQAIAGEKAKSDFLAVMSHEIRTPMNSVLGFAEMLAESTTLTPEDHALSQTIVSSGEVLLRILDDILDFSSMEARHVVIESELYSPRDLLRALEDIYKRQSEEKGLWFNVEVDASVPEAVLGDAGRIRQILANLLGNALKFTDKGFIRVTASAFGRAETGWVLEFTVQDTGTGIASEKRDTIFEPFTQADSSIARHHGGTGLGLTISRRLAELMGGDLGISGTAGGKGTTFTLHVPFVPSAQPLAPAPKPIVHAMTKEFAAQHPLSILVVEDDKINLKLMLSMLRKLGYEPFSAANGIEAVALCLREHPACIFMDVQMPGMSGIEAARKIREYESSRGLPTAYISALTANIQPENYEQCKKAGMNAYLNKPVRGEKIMNTLVEAVKFHAGDAAC